MRYDEAVTTFYDARPAGTPLPAVVAQPTLARRLRDVAEPLAMHAVWSSTTNERLASLGLDFLGSYVYGRASSLGAVPSAVVAATFAWFEPGMIAAILDPARAAVGLDTLIAARDSATASSLAATLAGTDPADVDSVDSVGDALLSAIAAAPLAGRPLFAGLQAGAVPADPYGKLWRACDLVREQRGDSHVAAVIATGLDPVEANILTERWLGFSLGTYSGTRGWPPPALDAAADRLRDRGLLAGDDLTASGLALRNAIEEATDVQATSVVNALGPRLDDVCQSLERWSAMCISAGAFPRDELKRAAG